MKVAIVGSRTPNKTFAEFASLVEACVKTDKIEVVSGGAKGIDAFAEHLAELKGWPITIFRPDYSRYEGRVAPLVRNRQIAEYCDVMLAFPSAESRGTHHVVNLARKLGKSVYTF